MLDAAEKHSIINTAWREAVLAVPRELFLPGRVWATNPDDQEWDIPVDRETNPDSWLEAAYSPDAVVTQLDDGVPDERERRPTSSASAPSIVVAMLYDLDVHDGHRVLEIGTGTGYNAGLLSHRLGSASVVTVEVDPGLAATAADNLKSAGYEPLVVTGDGLAGHPAAAPYDRVVATLAVETVPVAWIEQCAVGGVVVSPWRAPNGPQAVARLVRTARGAAVGHFTRRASFMSARSQRPVFVRHADYEPDPWPGEHTREAVTGLTAQQVFVDDADPFLFAAGVRLPAWRSRIAADPGGGRQVWLYDPAGTSWAVAALRDDGEGNPVYQAGDRSLWDEVEAAYAWWVEQGEPGVTRFGLTVDQGGQRVWLDEPGNPV